MWYWINNYRRGAGAYELFGWPCCFFNAGDNLVWSKRDISVISLISSSFTSWEKKEELSVFLKQLCVWVFFFKFKLMGATPQLSSHFDCTVAQSCVNVTSAFFHSRPPSSLKHWQTSENSDESAQTVICYITYPHLERVTMLPLQIEHSM